MQSIRINFCKIIDVIKEIIGQETDAKGNYLSLEQSLDART